MSERDVMELLTDVNPVRVADLHEAAPGDLLDEITREPARTPFTSTRHRVAVLVGAAAGTAAVAVVLSIVLSGGSGAEASVLHVRTVHGPNWRAAARSGTGVLPPTVTEPVSAVSSTAPKTEIGGGTPEERQLLQAIVDGMQPTAIERIELATAGNDVALHMQALNNSSRTQWEESLIAAALRDRAGAAGDALTVRLYAGDANGAYLPPGPTTPLAPATQGGAAAAKQLFENAAAKIGVQLQELTVYEPDGIAIVATLQSDDPASFLLHQMPTFLAALGDRWTGFDGTYVSLLDSSGKTVFTTSTNGRLLSGSAGAAPYLAGCSPVANWGPTPPPCPSK